MSRRAAPKVNLGVLRRGGIAVRCRRSDSGFTLMEVLVVLTITGMVAAVLLQALSQVYGMQQRFGDQIERSQGGALQIEWYRQVVQQLQPDFPDGAGRLRGNGSRFSSLGLNPFTQEPGAPKAMELSLRSVSGGTELRLRADGNELVLASWPEVTEAAIVYIDATGQRHDQWPPAMGSWPALPASVQLRLRQGQSEQWIVASPRATYQPYRQVKLPGL